MTLAGEHPQHQQLYASLTANRLPRNAFAPHVTADYNIDYDDKDTAAMQIQSYYRGRLGKKEYDRMLIEFDRRERAAIRVQCCWRRRMGYSQMLMHRAKVREIDLIKYKLLRLLPEFSNVLLTVGPNCNPQPHLITRKNHDDNAAATKLQSFLRAKHDRQKYLHKRAFMSKQVRPLII